MAEAAGARWRATLGACGAAVAVLVVATAADATPKGTTASPHLTSLNAPGDLLSVVLVVLGALSGGAIVWALWPGRSHQPRGAGARNRAPKLPWWQRVLNAGVVALTALVLGGLFVELMQHARKRKGGVILGSRGLLAAAAAVRKAARQSASHAPVSIGSGTAIALGLGAVAVVGLLGGLGYLLLRRRARARRAAAPVAEVDGALLEDAAARALGAFDAETDPRRAILHAYRALEEGVVVADARRVPSEAPLEFRDRLVAAGAPAVPARRFTELFELARFSDHAVSGSQRDEAMSALEALRSGGGDPP